jgi:hypothetical protein
MAKLDPNVVHHPAVIEQFNKRASDAQLRIADEITAFAGSMNFVYLHVVLFAVWKCTNDSSATARRPLRTRRADPDRRYCDATCAVAHGRLDARYRSSANCSGTQRGARFSMNACIPSRGSSDSASEANIVW